MTTGVGERKSIFFVQASPNCLAFLFYIQIWRDEKQFHRVVLVKDVSIYANIDIHYFTTSHILFQRIIYNYPDITKLGKVRSFQYCLDFKSQKVYQSSVSIFLQQLSIIATHQTPKASNDTIGTLYVYYFLPEAFFGYKNITIAYLER